MTFASALLLGGFGLGCATAPPPEEAVTVSANNDTTMSTGAQGALQDQPDMDWWKQSMKTRAERVAWFREARFGMFIHWGAYSHAGGVWEGKPVEGYAEHIMR